MSAKKKKKPGAAQNLIDSLLDERTPTPSKSAEGTGVVRLRDDDPIQNQEFSENSIPDADFSEPLLISVADHEMESDLKLEGSAKKDTIALGGSAAKKENERPAMEDEATKTSGPVRIPESPLPDLGSSESNPEQERTVRLDTRAKKKETLNLITSSQATDLESRLPAKSPENEEPSKVDRGGITELKTVMKARHEKGELPARPVSSSAYGSSEAALRQSESLRIAQSRIGELEGELERLRRENEKLASAGETLGRRADELISKLESLEMQSKEADRIHNEEKKVFRGQVQQKERDLGELRSRLEDMEARLEGNFKKIRVRERELEHRLEIVRMESQTLVSTKDKMILDLKRQIDQLAHENEYGKQKSQELYNQFKEKQETARRVVRALRIALTILEGEEDGGGKKSE